MRMKPGSNAYKKNILKDTYIGSRYSEERMHYGNWMTYYLFPQ